MNVYPTMNVMWNNTARQILEHGQGRDSRAGESSELVGQAGVLLNSKSNFLLSNHRKADPRYGAAELLWYLSGDPSTRMIQSYAPSYEKFTEPDGKAHGAYGWRWASNPGFFAKTWHDKPSQLDAAIDLLIDKPETRQCVITMWDSGDLVHAIQGDKRDLPCTMSLQFLLSERWGQQYLDAVGTMRSNDLWFGMPYDVFCFTSLQQIIASVLNVRPGTYAHHVGSMHVYDKHVDRLIEATDDASLLPDLVSIDQDDSVPMVLGTRPHWMRPGRIDDRTIRKENVKERINTAINYEAFVRDKKVTGSCNSLVPALHGDVGNTILSDLVLLCWDKQRDDFDARGYLESPRLLKALEMREPDRE